MKRTLILVAAGVITVLLTVVVALPLGRALADPGLPDGSHISPMYYGEHVRVVFLVGCGIAGAFFVAAVIALLKCLKQRRRNNAKSE